MTTRVLFLGFIVTPDGMSMDPKKNCTIKEWPVPQNVHDVRNFHSLPAFY